MEQMLRKFIAILIIICFAVTGSLSGIPDRIVSDEGPAVYAASYPALKQINYTATGNQRLDVVGFATTQVGYSEGKNNNTYFGAWYGLNKNPWCAMFVCWCAAKAGVPTSVIPKLASADRSWAKKQGVYYKSRQWGGTYTPQPGDLIYFSWSVRDYADHIGIVSGTGKVNGKTMVYTIEGNKHDKVCQDSYAIDNRFILGYASPRYKNYVAVIHTGDPAASAISGITGQSSESDPVGSTYYGLKLRSKKQGKHSIDLIYRKPAGTVKFVVFGAPCGAKNKYRQLMVGGRTAVTVKMINSQKLKKNTYYKFIVIALDKNDRVLSVSKAIHVATKGGTLGNTKSIKRISPKKATKTMTVGATFKPTFKRIKPVGKKLQKHRGLSYESSNPNVAVVSGAGIITAKAPGTCYVYAYSQNGRSSYVKIVVTQPPITQTPVTKNSAAPKSVPQPSITQAPDVQAPDDQNSVVPDPATSSESDDAPDDSQESGLTVDQ